MVIKFINDPTVTQRDAYQSLVFETVVNGPHQEPEGPQILESMKKKKKKFDKLPRPKTNGTGICSYVQILGQGYAGSKRS
jgi:hypothetical protein